MEGEIKVSYIIMCKNDVNETISLTDILKNEKVEKIIKSEFAKGLRNIKISQNQDIDIFVKTQKEIFEFTVNKSDFADILELAEEDAKKHKRTKRDCDGVELVNIITID